MLAQYMRARPLTPYHSWIDATLIERLEHHGRALNQHKIYEINSTAIGGGVVELLRSQLPLTRGLGIDAHWLVMPPDKDFFAITKQIHNALQGKTPDKQLDLNYYADYTQSVARTLPLDGDLYILHDPQTLGLIPSLIAAGKTVIWRCHIDLTQSDPAVHKWVRDQLDDVAAIIVSLHSYAHGLASHKIRVVTPAIDPLAAKNQPLSEAMRERVLRSQAIDPTIPFIAQVSRYDRFKDPLGVIDVYDQIRHYIPGLQCVLLGNDASDDPEGREVYAEVRARAATSPGKVHVICKDSELLANAIQDTARAVIQYSSREGFGLTVTEALWKKAVVLARPVGGIQLQIIDGKTGVAATGKPRHDAERLAEVLQSPKQSLRLQTLGHEYVRRHFITPVMLEKYLSVYQAVLPSRIPA